MHSLPRNDRIMQLACNSWLSHGRNASQAAFLSNGGVASLAAVLHRRREPTVLAAVLAAVTAFVRAATAAAAGPGGRQGSKEPAAAVPECGRARAEPAASGPVVVDPANPSGCCGNRTAARAAAHGCGESSRAAATPAHRTPTLPMMLALDDGLVAAVVMILRRRTPDGVAEPNLALPALQLISTIVTAKAAARQLIRYGPCCACCGEEVVCCLPLRHTHAQLFRLL